MGLRLCGGCRLVCLGHGCEEGIDVGCDDKASADLAKHTQVLTRAVDMNGLLQERWLRRGSYLCRPGQITIDISYEIKTTRYIQQDAVLKAHFDGAALVYLELADPAVDVCWRLLLVYVLGHGRGRFRVGRERDVLGVGALALGGGIGLSACIGGRW